MKEVGLGCRELITPDEPTVSPKPLFDPIVVENGQSDGRLPDPTCTNQSGGFEAVYETKNLLDQLAAPKQCPLWWGRGLPR